MSSQGLDLAVIKSQRAAAERSDRRPRGAHNDPAERGLATRLLQSALTDLCFDRGFSRLTVAEVCRSAGLSPAVFRSHYANLEACFLEICVAEHRRYKRAAAAAAAGLGEWRHRLRATAYALYRALGADERLRWLTIVEPRTAGGRPALLLDRSIRSLYDLIDEGRAEPLAPPRLTRATAEFLGGAIFDEVFIASARRRPLRPEQEVVPEMMYLTVLPYLGEAAATEELHIPPPIR
jgi:AcrR family transcriptional regulator